MNPASKRKRLIEWKSGRTKKIKPTKPINRHAYPVSWIRAVNNSAAEDFILGANSLSLSPTTSATIIKQPIKIKLASVTLTPKSADTKYIIAAAAAMNNAMPIAIIPKPIIKGRNTKIKTARTIPSAISTITAYLSLNKSMPKIIAINLFMV